MPQMLQDIVRTEVTGTYDFEVVGEIPKTDPRFEDRLFRETGERGADVVVTELWGEGIPELGGRLLYAYPTLGIVAVAGDGRRATRIEMRPQIIAIAEVSVSGLLDAIRAVARRSA